MSKNWKILALISGIGLGWIGLAVFLSGMLVMNNLISGNSDSSVGMIWIAGVWMTLGCGLILIIHTSRSLKSYISKPAKLPPLWLQVWGLVLLAGVGWTIFTTPVGDWLFPVIFLLTAAAPPLLVLSWGSETREILTWRQLLLCFVIGSTAAVFLAILLEAILPAFVLVIIQGLYDRFSHILELSLNMLTEGRISGELTSPFFIIAMLEIAIIAPLVEEFVKPLVVLPMIKHSHNSRQAFWIGATAGVGFAAFENLLYIGLSGSAWLGVLALRAWGAAIHPLGSGLVGMGWYEKFHPNNHSGWEKIESWLRRFGTAVSIHALWNGGSLVILTLASTNFFGKSSADVNLFGYTIAGIGLAFLAIVGVGGLIMFRTLAQKPGDGETLQLLREGSLKPISQPQERSLALWAAACLLTILTLLVEALRALGTAQH